MIGIVGLEQFSAAQVLCMGVAVGNVGMNADELRSTFTAECYTAVHLVRSQSAGRTAWWPSTSWSLCWRKNWNNVKWGCPGNEASLWVSNILGFFCFFFVYFYWTLMSGFRYAMWRKDLRGKLHINLSQGACTSKAPWGLLLIQSGWQCKLYINLYKWH